MELFKNDKLLSQPQATPLTQSKPLNIAISSPKSLYCADYFNDHTNTGSFGRIFEGLKVVAGIKPDENQRQAVLDEVVHLRLCAIRGTGQTQIAIPVLVNNEEQTLHLQQMSGCALIGFSNGNGQPIKGLRSLNMGFAGLEEKLAAQIAHALLNPVNKLAEPSEDIDWFEITIGNSKEESRPTTDTGMMIKRDGRFATVVVDGSANKSDEQSAQLAVFGKAVVTAALHTVECGILTLGLEGDELHAFFVVTVKLLLQAQNRDMQEWPKLNGVVFYQEAGVFGMYKKLEYGSDVVGKNYVNVNVADTVPYEGFNDENRCVHLTATRNMEDRDDALHVSVDVFELIAGKDDFVVFPISTNSSRYKYVGSPPKPEMPQKLLVETKEEKAQRVLAEQRLEKQIQRADQQRIRNNETADIFFRELKEFAEEYDGPNLNPDTLPLQRLMQQKEQLIYKQTELLNELKKSSGSEQKIEKKYNEVQILQNKVSAQLVRVCNIFMRQEKVQEKMQKDLDQLKIKLEQGEQLQTAVLSQQKKLDSVLKQKKVLDQELGKQKEFDEILMGQNLHLTAFKERLEKNGSETKKTNEINEII